VSELTLQSESLQFRYPGGELLEFPAMQLGQAESLLLMGPSGSGKSTWIQLLSGLLRAQKGKVQLLGQNIADLSARKLDQFRARHLGIIFQQARFIPSLNADENLNLARNLAGNSASSQQNSMLLDGLGISKLISKRPSQMSVGEKQRLSIARALVNHPSLLIADEPSASLDDANCERVIDLLQQKAVENNCSLLIVTHDSRLQTRFSNRIELSA
jgi:putative ABC transport system ATP-binding protein